MGVLSAGDEPSAALLGTVVDSVPIPLLVLRAPDLLVVAANAAYLAGVDKTWAQLGGTQLFDTFPNSPLRGEHDQQSDVRSFLEATVDTGTSQSFTGLRFDIPTADGFDVRFWDATNVPVTDERGTVTHVLQYSQDVTDLRAAETASRRDREVAESATRRVAGLTEVALALSEAQSLADLEEIVVHRGSRVLGAHGGSICTPAEDGTWRITLNADVDARSRALYDHVPHDSPYPGCETARSGQTILLPTREASMGYHPLMAEVVRRRKRDAWAFLPLVAHEEVIGALSVCWVEDHAVTPEEMEILQAFAAQCAQSLQRLLAIETERRTARQIAQLAASLQKAMLSEPPVAPGLEIQVRYRTAVDAAQVGGDWYDALIQPDDSVMLAIGDVAGHDHLAAAAMGQVRVLLRSLAYTGREPDPGHEDRGYSPASILTRFEAVAEGLGLDHLATAVLARVAAPVEEGPRSVTWSNAGNMPPIHLLADGDAVPTEVKPDLMLGVDPATDRHDHRVDLAVGDALLVFTDGLVERRGASIDDGLARLLRVLHAHGALPLGRLCDVVLAEMVPFAGEDDIALLAVRHTGPAV